MKLDFNWKYKFYELRAVPKRLVRLAKDEENQTIELVKWSMEESGEKFCFTLAYWQFTKEGYELRVVGDRMFEYIEVEDISPIWKQLTLAQKVLDDFELDATFEEYVE